MAGHARPHGCDRGGDRRRTVACRLRGMGILPAGATAPGRPMGRRARHAVLVVEHVHAGLAARPGDRSRQPARARRDRSRPRPRHLGAGVRRLAVLSRRVEPCINGRVVALGAYFGESSERLVDRLLSEQLADGGWNCEAERGSVRSSFHTTICVLEGLLAYEHAFGSSSTVTDARQRAERYLLERRLLRRLSSGEMIDPLWTRFSFPTLWHYDVLRALDYLRAAGIPPDPRVTEAIGIVVARRQDDGRWPLDVQHHDTLYPKLAGDVGKPNRWVTLRARRVLGTRAAAR